MRGSSLLTDQAPGKLLLTAALRGEEGNATGPAAITPAAASLPAPGGPQDPQGSQAHHHPLPPEEGGKQ